MSESILKEISPTLRRERGMADGVSIWRRGGIVGSMWAGSVEEFLLDPANQSGEWAIDGGWGGPPGPIVVRWHPDGHWENGGYCGHRLS